MIGRKIFFFAVAVFIGLGAADRQVREMRDAQTELAVYGWRVQEASADIVWMGEEYPAVSWNEAGDLIVEAGGLGCNLTDGGKSLVQTAKVGAEKGIDLLFSLWRR